MCDMHDNVPKGRLSIKTIPVRDAAGMVLAHDVTEIRSGEFKGRAFRRGHIVRREDICHLQRLGKENLYVLNISAEEMHEDEAADMLAKALMGDGVEIQGEPKEGKISIIAGRDGLLKIDREALLSFNMIGDVMCATLHTNTRVKKGQTVAGTKAIPLVVKRDVVEKAISAARHAIEVRELKRPKAGVVITGSEVYFGRIKDAFASVIEKKVRDFNGEIAGIYYAPDDERMIEQRLRELIEAGADLLITTGGMSVDPDDVTRFAIRNLGAVEMTYGSSMLPGAMFLVAYINVNVKKKEIAAAQDTGGIPVLGIPACGMYHKNTVFDLILPRVLAGEKVGRGELAELGHGGLCMQCPECHYPVCPFGKS
ncbi:MAG: molybdopterin-binding protein [Dissulfurispiraceae bacterium]